MRDWDKLRGWNRKISSNPTIAWERSNTDAKFLTGEKKVQKKMQTGTTVMRLEERRALGILGGKGISKKRIGDYKKNPIEKCWRG